MPGDSAAVITVACAHWSRRTTFTPRSCRRTAKASYAALRELFFVDGNNFHHGRSLDGQFRFTAFPIQAADSLAFEPVLTTTALIPDRRSLADPHESEPPSATHAP